ncbi:MAG TPA: hypothetical protein VGF28_14385 [Thermoanaerobaculia bacterium]
MRVVLGLGAISATCFLVQGSFGAGHGGTLDRVIFISALPWSLVPWPVRSDFVSLVLLPVVLNASIVAGLRALMRRRQRRCGRRCA